mmetsp:Transcript_34546/g.98241  ORF Transcript_34546/g.98241 Transcript_34546/m.98241 type:complete len:232 (+) Transcript_34546:665-1360(+)
MTPNVAGDSAGGRVAQALCGKSTNSSRPSGSSKSQESSESDSSTMSTWALSSAVTDKSSVTTRGRWSLFRLLRELPLEVGVLREEPLDRVMGPWHGRDGVTGAARGRFRRTSLVAPWPRAPRRSRPGAETSAPRSLSRALRTASKCARSFSAGSKVPGPARTRSNASSLRRAAHEAVPRAKSTQTANGLAANSRRCPTRCIAVPSRPVSKHCPSGAGTEGPTICAYATLEL